MKIRKIMLSLSFVFAATALWASSPVGLWTTIDDKTGAKRGEVEIYEKNNTLYGRILKVYPHPGDTGVCHKCPGKFKDKPIEGLRFLWGLHHKGYGEWDKGYILDPKTGHVYRAKIRLKGDKLYVRGYKGISILGRTQIWVRH